MQDPKHSDTEQKQTLETEQEDSVADLQQARAGRIAPPELDAVQRLLGSQFLTPLQFREDRSEFGGIENISEAIFRAVEQSAAEQLRRIEEELQQLQPEALDAAEPLGRPSVELGGSEQLSQAERCADCLVHVDALLSTNGATQNWTLREKLLDLRARLTELTER